MDNKWHFNIGYLLFAWIAILLLQQWWITAQQIEVAPYSEFVDLLRQDKIASVEVGDRSLTASLKEALPNGRKSLFVLRVDPAMAQDLEAAKVKFSGAPDSGWLTNLLSWIVPVAIFFVFWSFSLAGWARAGSARHVHRPEQGQGLCREGH